MITVLLLLGICQNLPPQILDPWFEPCDEVLGMCECAVFNSQGVDWMLRILRDIERPQGERGVNENGPVHDSECHQVQITFL